MYNPTREAFFPTLGRGHWIQRAPRRDEDGRVLNKPLPCACWSLKQGTAKDHSHTSMRQWVEEHKGRVTYVDNKGKSHPVEAYEIEDQMLTMTGGR